MSKKLFVGNLSYNADEDSVLELFRNHGFEPVSAHVVLDRDTGRPRGFAFVEFNSEEEAQNAREQCDGQQVQGRSVRLDSANERPPRGRGGGGGPRRPRY